MTWYEWAGIILAYAALVGWFLCINAANSTADDRSHKSGTDAQEQANRELAKNLEAK